MPVFRVGDRLAYYAHVPKCAGSAVENYLRDRFGTLALVDTRHANRPEETRWSRTSPQHITVSDLDRIVPPEMRSASFTVVRHPVARLISVFQFQVEVEKLVPEGMSFSDWLAALPKTLETTPFAFDNHIRPMDELVPNDAAVFHLEHGLGPLVPWLDKLAGDETGPREFSVVNQRGAHTKSSMAKPVPSDDDLRVIEKIYRTDFKRFGYRLNEKLPLSEPPATGQSAARPKQGIIGSLLGRLQA